MNRTSTQPRGINPFRGSVLNDAWTQVAAAADVEVIHQNVFRTCCEAVEAVRTGNSSAGVAVYGEPGSGKTHLIHRLRRRLTDLNGNPSLERLSQAFAYVRLSVNAASIYRHVRKRVAEDLLRVQGSELSQLERMVLSRLMEREQGAGNLAPWWEHFQDVRRDEIDGILESFAASVGLSHNFTRVLSHLIARRHRLDVRGWLLGESLSDSAYERLDIGQESNDDPEQAAKEILSNFTRLAGPQVPLVLCFDQVEALQVAPDDRAALFEFGNLISHLHDSATNVVLISCMQLSLYQQLKSSIAEFAFARIKSFAAKSLEPLRQKEVTALLKQRLSALDLTGLKPADAAKEELWPVTTTDVSRVVGQFGCTARQALDAAALRWDAVLHGEQPSEPTLSLPEWLEDEWERRFTEARVRTDSNQSGEVLRNGIPRLVRLVDSHWSYRPGTQDEAVDYLFIGPEKEARVGVKVCEGNNTSLAAQMKWLVAAYPKFAKDLEKVVLLRDERNPISRNAKKLHERMEKLKSEPNLNYYRVPTEAVAALEALGKLLSDAQAGDLDFEGRALPPETVQEWLREHLPTSLQDVAHVLMTPHPPEPAASPAIDRLVDRLQEHLQRTPIVALNDAARALETTPSALLEVAERNVDMFGVVRGESTVVFTSRAPRPA